MFLEPNLTGTFSNMVGVCCGISKQLHACMRNKNSHIGDACLSLCDSGVAVVVKALSSESIYTGHWKFLCAALSLTWCLE